MSSSLIEIIDGLDALDDSDGFDPPCIFAEGGPDSRPSARASVCPGDEQGSNDCPHDGELSYVLMVQQAIACIRVWSQWRGGRRPNAADKFAAVMYYSRHDAWLPLE